MPGERDGCRQSGTDAGREGRMQGRGMDAGREGRMQGERDGCRERGMDAGREREGDGCRERGTDAGREGRMQRDGCRERGTDAGREGRMQGGEGEGGGETRDEGRGGAVGCTSHTSCCFPLRWPPSCQYSGQTGLSHNLNRAQAALLTAPTTSPTPLALLTAPTTPHPPCYAQCPLPHLSPSSQSLRRVPQRAGIRPKTDTGIRHAVFFLPRVQRCHSSASIMTRSGTGSQSASVRLLARESEKKMITRTKKDQKRTT